MRIFVRPKASADLEEQALFIARDDLRIASQLYEACERTFSDLVKMPRMGQIYPTAKKQLVGIRFIPVSRFEKHLIFYIPQKDHVDIVRILYATRDIARILK